MVDLSQKVLEALQQNEVPATPPVAIAGLISANGEITKLVPENAEVIGHVPNHLRRLYVLYRKLEADQLVEQHRRCVDILGRERYDNEHVEFMVYNEVRADPNFGGIETVKVLFDWSIMMHFPALPVNQYDHPRYHIGPNWEVYAVTGKNKEAQVPAISLGIIIR